MYFGRQNQQNLQVSWTWLVRKKEGVKDNAKDFGMSKWVNDIVIYSTGKMQVAQIWERSGVCFKYVTLACLVDVQVEVWSRQLNTSLGLREALLLQDDRELWQIFHCTTLNVIICRSSLCVSVVSVSALLVSSLVVIAWKKDMVEESAYHTVQYADFRLVSVLCPPRSPNPYVYPYVQLWFRFTSSR